MILDCMLRLTPYGELIKGSLDTETGVILNIPSEVYTFPILSPKLYKISYTELVRRGYSALYKLMLSNRDIIFGVDVGGLGFYYQISNEIYFCSNELITMDKVYITEEVTRRQYLDIGLRPTIVNCVSRPVKQFRLVYDVELEKVLTSDGVFSLGNLDISRFGKVDPNVHSHMISYLNSGSRFGLCWYDKSLLWLYVEDGILKI